MNAQQHFREGRVEEARDLCLDELQHSPDQVDTLFLLAHCWLALGELTSARDELVRAVKLAPQRSEIWHDLGCCYLDRGEHFNAQRAFYKASELGNHDSREALGYLRGIRPRDLILMFEASDEAGVLWDGVLDRVGLALGELAAGDRFALVGFNQDLDGFKQGIFCPAEESEQALHWLSRVTPGGGADITVLMERVATIQAEPGRRLEALAVLAGPVILANPESVRAALVFPLHVVAVGGNFCLTMSELAQATGGGLSVS